VVAIIAPASIVAMAAVVTVVTMVAMVAMDAVIQIAGCMTGKLKMRKKKCESVKV